MNDNGIAWMIAGGVHASPRRPATATASRRHRDSRHRAATPSSAARGSRRRRAAVGRGPTPVAAPTAALPDRPSRQSRPRTPSPTESVPTTRDVAGRARGARAGRRGSSDCCSPSGRPIRSAGSCCTTRPTARRCRMRPSWPASAAATRPPSPSCGRARSCWTSGPAAASTSCCRRRASVRPASPTAWT